MSASGGEQSTSGETEYIRQESRDALFVKLSKRKFPFDTPAHIE